MMFKLLAVTALSASASAKVSPEMQGNLEKIQSDGVAADSSFGRHLLAKSRQLEDESDNYSDMTFVSGYSIKFLGCHHVTQWDEDETAWEENVYEEEEKEGNNNNEDNYKKPYVSAANGRLTQKGLVRFRLCKSDSCFDHFNNGCSSNYGEYVIDLSTFLDAYIAHQVEQVQDKCSKYQSKCSSKCSGSSNASSCYTKCYSGYNLNAALCSSANDQYSQYSANSGEYGFDLKSYLSCSQYSVYDANGDQISSYLGPYCSDQGGDIRLGFFEDRQCIQASTYQASYFEKLTGVEVPYTKSSIVSTKCLSCEATSSDNQVDYYNYDQNGNKNYYDASTVSNMCASVYMASGKCETNMGSQENRYAEEGGCTYIEGVKRLKGDGIIRGNQNIRSKPASVVIGIFTSLAVLLGMYVYHLKTQISRSRVNLAGATTSLA